MLLKVTRPLDELKDEAISKLKEDAFNHITSSLPIHKQINMLERYIYLKTANLHPTNPLTKELTDIETQLDWKNSVLDEVKLAEEVIGNSQSHHVVRGINAATKSSFPINPKVNVHGNN